MKTYVIIKPYESDDSLLRLHNLYLKHRNPLYGFLYKKDKEPLSHLFIRVDLDEQELTYLSLLHNIQTIRELHTDEDPSDIINSLDQFNTVAYFYISNADPISHPNTQV